jgi:hypothetical protein
MPPFARAWRAKMVLLRDSLLSDELRLAMICSRSWPSSREMISRAARSRAFCSGVSCLEVGPPQAGAFQCWLSFPISNSKQLAKYQSRARITGAKYSLEISSKPLL